MAWAIRVRNVRNLFLLRHTACAISEICQRADYRQGRSREGEAKKDKPPPAGRFLLCGLLDVSYQQSAISVVTYAAACMFSVLWYSVGCRGPPYPSKLFQKTLTDGGKHSEL